MSSPALRRARIGATAVVVAVAGLTSLGPAGAEGPEATGFWNRVKPTNPEGLEALGNPFPPPADVPQESLLVSTSGSEILNMAALRYAASGPADATLILEFDDGSDSEAGSSTPPDPDVAVLACAVTTGWDGETDGAWENRAQWDPDACTTGVGNAGNLTMSWPIDERHFIDGAVVDTIEIALVPTGSSPFRAIFDKPGLTSLRANDGSPLLSGGGLSFGAPAAAPPTTTPPVVTSPPAPAPAVSAPTPSFSSPVVSSPVVSPPVTPAPEAAPGPPAAPAVVNAAPISSDDGTDDRLRAMALLSLMGIGLALAGSGGVTEPRLIGGLARRTTASV